MREIPRARENERSGQVVVEHLGETLVLQPQHRPRHIKVDVNRVVAGVSVHELIVVPVVVDVVVVVVVVLL